MTKYVMEFMTRDGLGSMMWKKLYAMCYAMDKKYLFKNSEFEWFLIHESDCLSGESDESYKQILQKFNSFLLNPWSRINFEDIPNLELCQDVGLGNKSNHGFLDTNYSEVAKSHDFLMHGPIFNPLQPSQDEIIVIHMRRGNATFDNPRYDDDNFYNNVFMDLPELIDRLKFSDPKIYLCTDGRRSSNNFKPVGEQQQNAWMQNYLHKSEDGSYQTTKPNFDYILSICPNISIIDNLDTFDSFVFLVNARVLITSNSAFSQSAGILSKNMVIATRTKNGINPHYGIYANKIGSLSENGNFIWNDCIY